MLFRSSVPGALCRAPGHAAPDDIAQPGTRASPSIAALARTSFPPSRAAGHKSYPLRDRDNVSADVRDVSIADGPH